MRLHAPSATTAAPNANDSGLNGHAGDAGTWQVANVEPEHIECIAEGVASAQRQNGRPGHRRESTPGELAGRAARPRRSCLRTARS